MIPFSNSKYSEDSTIVFFFFVFCLESKHVVKFCAAGVYACV